MGKPVIYQREGGRTRAVAGGYIIADGRAYLGIAWWVSLFPGLCVFLAVMAFNLLGDGLRDALDPRMKVL